MPIFTSPPQQLNYNLQVWEIVRQIPAGNVSSYGRIAAMIIPPNEAKVKSYRAFGARWVGGAMAKCPNDIPWWRILNAQGKISERPSASRQRELLEAEGVLFDASGKIDFSVFLWKNSSSS